MQPGEYYVSGKSFFKILFTKKQHSCVFPFADVDDGERKLCLAEATDPRREQTRWKVGGEQSIIGRAEQNHRPRRRCWNRWSLSDWQVLSDESSGWTSFGWVFFSATCTLKAQSIQSDEIIIRG